MRLTGTWFTARIWSLPSFLTSISTITKTVTRLPITTQTTHVSPNGRIIPLMPPGEQLWGAKAIMCIQRSSLLQSSMTNIRPASTQHRRCAGCLTKVPMFPTLTSQMCFKISILATWKGTTFSIDQCWFNIWTSSHSKRVNHLTSLIYPK